MAAGGEWQVGGAASRLLSHYTGGATGGREEVSGRDAAYIRRQALERSVGARLWLSVPDILAQGRFHV